MAKTKIKAKADVVRNKSELKCTTDEYAQFFLAADPLYADFDPLNFVRFIPAKDMAQALSEIDPSQPLGIKGSECAYPVDRSEWIQLLLIHRHEHCLSGKVSFLTE